MQNPIMNFRITLTVISLLVFSFSWVQAQDLEPDYPSTSSGIDNKDVLIKGRIVDQESQEPLEFAAVSLFSQSDSSLITGVTTDLNGQFELKASLASPFYVEINYLSFENKTLSNLSIANGQRVLDLGIISLSENSQVLDEVEVVAEKSSMQLQLDKRVFNVGKDLANLGGSAVDVLENVPSVTVDVEGNVSLRGSENVRLLIDGKPSGLTGPNALRQLQGDMIESIEVITNPSARYDAEGEAGIINIKLKKGSKKGVNGSFGLTTGTPDNHGLSYSVNFRRNKLNLFSTFGLRYRKNPGGGYNNQRFLNDAGEWIGFNTNQDTRRGGLSGNFQFGANWFINPKTTLTTSFLYRKSNEDNDSFVEYQDLDVLGNITALTTRTNDEQERELDLEGTISFERIFSSKNHKLNVDFKVFQNEETATGSYVEQGPLNVAPILQRSDNLESNYNYLIQADYIQPIGQNGAKFETGTRITLRSITNDFLSEEQDEQGDWITIPSFDDQLKFQENIYAAYAIFAKESDKFSYQLGLRAEYSDMITELVRSNTVNDRNFLNLFPSINLSYSIHDEDQLQMSYSRRISRPRFRHLLPFFNLNDSRNQFSGNPNLNPEFTNSFELGYLKYWEKGSLLSSVYYRHRTGVVERITTINENGTTIRFPVNLSTQNAYGLEFSLSQDITKSWSLTANWNFYRALTEGEYEGVIFEADAVTWSSRFMTKLKLFKSLDFQTSFNYRAPRNTPQGRSLAVYNLDMGFSQDILKDKGTLSLSIRDLFNTRVRRSIIDLEDFYSESAFRWRNGRQITMTLTYRLNQKKSRRGGRGGNRDFEGGFDEGF